MAGEAEKKVEKEEIEDQVEETEVEEDGIEIELVDDTPEEDRGRAPMPKELVEELEADELEEYTGKVKNRLKQMKKVWHDERREKEAARREQEEAVNYAKHIAEENKRLKNTLSSGELQLLATYKAAAEFEVKAAKQEYKEALDTGEADKIAEAQQKMTGASYRLEQAKGYRPTLQPVEGEVEQQRETVVQPPRTDATTDAWQKRNEWWGSDEEMTGAAFGLHQRLLRDKGDRFVGTPEYWETIDTSMRRRFPEYFEGEEDAPANGSGKKATKRTKPATVVAPASRSTSSKKIRLTPSQVSLAKKLGLTPEQYAKEAVKLQAEK